MQCLMSALGVQGVEPSVGFDIEVKMATPPDVPVTPAHEVDRMVIAILDQVDQGLGARKW